MSQETRVSTPDDLESIVREYWDKKNRFVQYLANRMGVAQEAKDLAQNAWERAVKKRDAVENARNVSALLNTIALHEVINFASSFKLRVHVSFEEGADGLVILGDLGLEGDFTVLKTKRDPSGLSLYSGMIWPSRVEDLCNHPNRVHFSIIGLPSFILVDPHVLATSSQIVEEFEFSEEVQVEPFFGDGDRRFAALDKAIEELQKDFPIHTEILVLRGKFQMGWREISARVGLCTATCRHYFEWIKGVFRERYPELRALLGDA